MREQEKLNLTKVGIFVSVMIFILMIFIVTLSEENSWFDDKVTLRAIIPNAENLKTGGIVQLRGLKIGTVEAINIVTMDDVEVIMKINREQLQWIKTDSVVEIGSKGLVGDKLIEVKGGSEEAPVLDPAKDVLGASPSLSMDDIMKKGNGIAERVDSVLLKLELFLDQMNKDGQVSSSLSNLNKASSQLNTLITKMNQKDISAKLDNTLSNIDKMTKRINSGPGTMHSLIYQDDVHDQLVKLLGGAGRNKVLKYFIRESLKEE